MHHVHAWCPQRPGRVRCLRTGVTDGMNSHALNCRTISAAPEHKSLRKPTLC